CMSTRSNSSNLFSPLRDPESLIRQRNLGEPSSLFDFEEVMSIPHNNMGPPPAGAPPPNNNGPPLVVRPNGQAPRSIEELCQPSIDGRGGPIAPIPIRAMDFGLRYHMIQQVQNTCQFHRLPSDDANRPIDNFLEITQHMKQNGVSDDVLRLSLFPYSLTHHAIAWYDRLSRNSIHSFDDMMRKFLSKYFPPSMVKMMRQIQTIKSVDTKCETCGGPHSFIECPVADGYTQEAVYATTSNHNLGGNSYQPQGNFQAPNYQALNNQGRGQNFNQGNNNYQAPNNQALDQPSNELLNYIKINETNMRDMQNQITNMRTETRNDFETSMTKNQNEIKNMMNSFFQMQNPSGSRSLPSNTVANLRGDAKAITTRSGVAYDGPKILPTPSPLPKEVERETEVTKDKQRCVRFSPPKGSLLTSEDNSRVWCSGSRVGRRDVACEEYAQEVLGFLDSSTSGNPTPSDPIIASSSPSFTPFEGGDFILEEIETFLRTPEELSNLDDDYYDTEGDILYLEKLLNEEPSPNLPSMKNDDLKQVNVTMMKPSIEEPPELELKDLPSHLEYAFLEGTYKLPIIISKELKNEEKAALLKVLKSHKWAIA
ncbi:reverse transcriptase domain-containing protein, partial [Tanacetum coccineum]